MEHGGRLLARWRQRRRGRYRRDRSRTMPTLARGRHPTRAGALLHGDGVVPRGGALERPPGVAHSLLAALARLVNDNTPDGDRQELAPLIPSVIGLDSDDPRWNVVIARRAAAAASDRRRAAPAGARRRTAHVRSPARSSRRSCRPRRGRVRRCDRRRSALLSAARLALGTGLFGQAGSGHAHGVPTLCRAQHRAHGRRRHRRQLRIGPSPSPARAAGGCDHRVRGDGLRRAPHERGRGAAGTRPRVSLTPVEPPSSRRARLPGGLVGHELDVDADVTQRRDRRRIGGLAGDDGVDAVGTADAGEVAPAELAAVGHYHACRARRAISRLMSASLLVVGACSALEARGR